MTGGRDDTEAQQTKLTEGSYCIWTPAVGTRTQRNNFTSVSGFRYRWWLPESTLLLDHRAGMFEPYVTAWPLSLSSFAVHKLHTDPSTALVAPNTASRSLFGSCSPAPLPSLSVTTCSMEPIPHCFQHSICGMWVKKQFCAPRSRESWVSSPPLP